MTCDCTACALAALTVTVTTVAGVTVWLSALFLVKEENAHGDLSEGETVKVTARTAVQLLHPRDVCCRSSTRIQSLHLRAPLLLLTLHPPSSAVQATVKVDYGPRKLVTLQFFYPSQVASRKTESPMAQQGTEV